MQKYRALPHNNQIASLIFNDESIVPLGHEPIVNDGQIIGKTTSCAFGYRVGKPVALGQVSIALNEGDNLQVNIAGKLCKVTTHHEALFDVHGARMKL